MKRCLVDRVNITGIILAGIESRKIKIDTLVLHSGEGRKFGIKQKR